MDHDRDVTRLHSQLQPLFLDAESPSCPQLMRPPSPGPSILPPPLPTPQEALFVPMSVTTAERVWLPVVLRPQVDSPPPLMSPSQGPCIDPPPLPAPAEANFVPMGGLPTRAETSPAPPRSPPAHEYPSFVYDPHARLWVEAEPPPARSRSRPRPPAALVNAGAGYDVGRFTVAVPRDLVCPICLDVMNWPVETPCEHVFCLRCISTALQQRLRCPVDRQAVHPDALRPLPAIVHRILGALTLHCDRHGCDAVVALQDLQSHEEQCHAGHGDC